MSTVADLPTFIEALLDPRCYSDDVLCVELQETHISWIILAGSYAYKIKKPVDFGFLNFSTLNLRQFYCHEEIRLNSRLAPQLYLEVVSIGGTQEDPGFGVEPVFEYAVKMQRFPVTQSLDNLCLQQALLPDQIDALAHQLARFHIGLPPSTSLATCCDYGSADKIWLAVVETFHHLQELLPSDDQALLLELHHACEIAFAECRPSLEQRRSEGMVRECHGDLHLGNIVLLEGKPVPFDGIEFDANLRWIDILSDVAFLVMDLSYRQRADLAYRFLDAYLQETGDYAGLIVMRLFLAYRALVRAKVSALRSSQGQSSAIQMCRDYLALAKDLLIARLPALMITYGLPGCGKSTISELIVEKFSVIRLRSDVERKRLFESTSGESFFKKKSEIYTPQANQRTYGYLLDLSSQILKSGFSVIVDAAFLRRDERLQFQTLAQSLGIAFVILHVDSDESLIRERLKRRHMCGRDPSDADEGVYTVLKGLNQPLETNEHDFVIPCWNNGNGFQSEAFLPFWHRLASMTGLKPFDGR